MSYIVNTNTFADNITPPKKRLSKFIAFARVLLYPLQVLYDTMFGTYKDGNVANDWSVLTAYIIGDQVRYVDKSIYQCYVANTGNIPTNLSYWFKVQDKFVGIEPRMKYSPQWLLFEWALNEWFGGTFVNIPGDSDIYVELISTTDTPFWVGINSNESSLVVASNVDIFGWIQAVDLTAAVYDFTIWIPTSIWTPLATTDLERERIVRAFADTYVLAGVTYNLDTY